MGMDSYLMFIGASVVLCLVPGPDMAFLLLRSLAHGKRIGVAAALGINAGAYVHLLFAVAGLSAILATSALAFNVLKWLGAAYLIYLGLQFFLARGEGETTSEAPVASGWWNTFWQGFWSDVLNPKVAVFYLAFLPQFVDPNAGHTTLQLLFLGLTLNVIGILTNLLLVHFSVRLTQAWQGHHSLRRRLEKITGVVLVGLGLRLANERM